MSLVSRIDHVAIATWDLEGSYRQWRSQFGVGRVTGSAPDRVGFMSRQMTFANRGKLELIAPSAAPEPSFVDRFLARFGQAVHHLTLKVDDLGEALDTLSTAGVPYVDVNRDRAEWQDAFLSPRTTCGPVVQIARAAWTDEEFAQAHGHPVVPPREDATALHGVVLGHPDVGAGVDLWRVLGADVHREGSGAVCRWADAPLRVWLRPHGVETGLVVGPSTSPPDPDSPLAVWERAR